MKMIELTEFTKQLYTANNIKRIIVTSIKFGQFNEMTGYQYSINVKLDYGEGYKKRMLTITTNSTYLEDFECIDKNTLEEYFNVMLPFDY